MLCICKKANLFCHIYIEILSIIITRDRKCVSHAREIEKVWKSSGQIRCKKIKVKVSSSKATHSYNFTFSAVVSDLFTHMQQNHFYFTTRLLVFIQHKPYSVYLIHRHYIQLKI